MSDFTNIKDFGAVGDGKHDDTEAIKAAVAHAVKTGADCIKLSNNKVATNTEVMGREMYEQVESLFDLRISSSGAMITISLGGESMTVDYEAFQILRDSILALFQTELLALLDELMGEKKRYITELAWKHAASEEAVPVTKLATIRNRIGGK